MAKDPAFLFYSSDFLTGTLVMSFEDRGKYITILSYMHQNGRLSEETIRLLVGNISDSLRLKFGIDKNNLWFNSRLEEEVLKRSNFVDSRKQNGKKGGRPPKKPNIDLDENEKPTHNLPEDENENINVDENKYLNIDFEQKKEIAEALILHFGFQEMRFDHHKRTINTFVEKILKEGQAENFKSQFINYHKYKELSKENLHNFTGLIGTQAMKFENGAWNSENWEQKIINFKNQNGNKTKFEKTNDVFAELMKDYQNGNTAL